MGSAEYPVLYIWFLIFCNMFLVNVQKRHPKTNLKKEKRFYEYTVCQIFIDIYSGLNKWMSESVAVCRAPSHMCLQHDPHLQVIHPQSLCLSCFLVTTAAFLTQFCIHFHVRKINFQSLTTDLWGLQDEWFNADLIIERIKVIPQGWSVKMRKTGCWWI